MMAYHLTDVKWKDGSLHADIPISRISELFNVNHFIVSQTNPHAIPFMSKPLRTRKKQENDEEQSRSMVRRGWWVMRYLVTSELAHRFRQAVTMGLVPKILEATLFQVAAVKLPQSSCRSSASDVAAGVGPACLYMGLLDMRLLAPWSALHPTFSPFAL
jgi:predicted acylesterase/phospholipase RssA